MKHSDIGTVASICWSTVHGLSLLFLERYITDFSDGQINMERKWKEIEEKDKETIERLYVDMIYYSLKGVINNTQYLKRMANPKRIFAQKKYPKHL